MNKLILISAIITVIASACSSQTGSVRRHLDSISYGDLDEVTAEEREERELIPYVAKAGCDGTPGSLCVNGLRFSGADRVVVERNGIHLPVDPFNGGRPTRADLDRDGERDVDIDGTPADFYLAVSASSGAIQVYDVPLGESITLHFLSCPKKTRQPVCVEKFSRTYQGDGDYRLLYYSLGS